MAHIMTKYDFVSIGEMIFVWCSKLLQLYEFDTG